MFLKSLKPTMRVLRSQQDGVAIPAVLGMMAISLILSTVIVGSVVAGFGYTSMTSASVQSQAAADAGTAVAQAGLIAGTCNANNAVYASAVNAVPAYRATVWRSDGAGGWIFGCPVNATAQVQIISTGTANVKGLATESAGDKSYVWTVLTPPVSNTQIVAVGAAVYAYSSAGFGNSGTVTSVNGSDPDIFINTGNVTCTGAAVVNGDWVVKNGFLTVDNGCSVTGNVWASGRVTVNGGSYVGGNAVGAGYTGTGSSPTKGSVWSTSDVSISGGGKAVWGTTTAASFAVTSGSAYLGGNTWVYGLSNLSNSGNLAVQGNLTTKTKSGTGTVSGTTTLVPGGPAASPYPKPVSPVVPDWIDFTYDVNDWVGFTQKVLTSSQCDYNAMVTAYATFAGQPGILDMRACSAVTVSQYQQLAIANDLVIVANKFALGSSGGFTATNNVRLWLITPDNTPNALPTCPSGSSFTIDGNFTFSTPKISLMVYTPCDAQIVSGITFNGQVFGGEASIAANVHMGYVAVGLPKYDLSTGQLYTVTVPTTSGYVVSATRNMSTNTINGVGG